MHNDDNKIWCQIESIDNCNMLQDDITRSSNWRKEHKIYLNVPYTIVTYDRRNTSVDL